MSGNNMIASPVSSLKAALWIVVIISTTVNAQREWFGSSSQYKCHCAGNNCDNNGDCTGGADCVKGWFGPQCQYVDLSYTENDGTARQSFRDADNTTCNEDLNHQRVVMSFKRAFPFTWLRLVVSTRGLSLDNIEVTFADGDDNNIKCNNKRSAVVDSRTIDIYCDVAVEVTKVWVTGQAIGYLRSFYISGGRNVALKQSATQLTTLDGGDYGPENAVDGDTNQNIYSGSCSVSQVNSDPAIWTVTLSHFNEVNRYVLYNRDTQKDRLKGFVLTAYDKNSSPKFTYVDQETTALDVYTITFSTNSVKSVKIEANHTTDIFPFPILTLCEVEIFGDTMCPVATYGRECEQECHCANNEPCFVSTGMCPNGCAPGYTGTRCDQQCEYGKYGKDCNKDCSEFCNKNGTQQNESPCHHVSGTCLYGCVQNYTRLKCDTKPKESRADNSDSNPGLGVGLGIGLGVAALVVIVVVVIYCYRKRLSAKKSRRQRPPGYDPAEPTADEHGYNELFKSHDGYNLPTDEATSVVIVKSPSKNPAQDTVQYVNHEPTIYEDIDSVGAHIDQEKQSEPGHDNEGYENL